MSTYKLTLMLRGANTLQTATIDHEGDFPPAVVHIEAAGKTYVFDPACGCARQADGTVLAYYDETLPMQVGAVCVTDVPLSPPMPKLKAYTATIQVVVVSKQGPHDAADAIAEMLRNCDQRYGVGGNVLDWQYISDYGSEADSVPGDRRVLKQLDDFKIPEDPQQYVEGSVFGVGRDDLDPGVGSGTILVCMAGCLVTDVVSDTPERFKHLAVKVVDHDIEGVEADDEHLQDVKLADGKTEKVYVRDYAVEEAAITLINPPKPAGDVDVT